MLGLLKKNLSTEQARDELVADAFGDVLSKVDFAETVHKADKRLFDKIAEWLDKLLERFKKALRMATEGVTAQSDAAATLREAGDRAMHLFNSWSDAFASALENSTARTDAQSVDGEVQYEARYMDAKPNDDIIALVNKVITGDFAANEKVYLGKVPDGIAKKIFELTGVNANGFKIVIEARQIDHILHDHGVNGSADRSMSNAEDVAKIEYVINNPDTLSDSGRTKAYSEFVNGRNRTAKTVLYEKSIGEKSFYVVQAVPETKARTLYIVSAFIGKHGYKKRASQLINASGLNATSENDSANTLYKSISPTSENVNRENKGKQFSARDYTYETLIKKPDMKVTTVSSVVPDTRADVIAEAKKNAAAIGKTNKDGSVSVYVKDTKTDVVLGRDGLKHSLDRRLNVNAPVVMKAGEILHNSVLINELTAQKEDAELSYVLIGTATNKEGDLYIVRSVINKFSYELSSMDVLYAINAKKELAALNAPLFTEKSALGTNSFISIARLLDFVNNYFPDVLPESVLKHYGHESRPEGKLGESALFSARDVYDVLDIETRADLAEHILTYIEDEGGYRAQLKRSIEKGELNKIKLTAQAYKEAVKVYQDAYRDIKKRIGRTDSLNFY